MLQTLNFKFGALRHKKRRGLAFYTKNFFLRPRSHVAGYFRKRRFFLRIWLPSTRTCSGVFGHRKRTFSNALFRVEIFENGYLHLSYIRIDGRKRRFSNTITSCLGSRLTFPYIRFENGSCGRRFL